MKPARLDIIAILMGLAFSLMWSSAFTSARIIVAEAPPFLSLALRFAISGVLALGIAALMGQGFRLTRQQWILTAVFGLCQNALYLGLNFEAMQTISASIAAIIGSAMPLVVALIGWAAFGQRPTFRGWAGLFAGLIGVIVILSHRISGGADLYGIGLCLIGLLALSIATLVLRGASAGGNVMTIVGLQMLVGSAALAIAGSLLETWDVTWTPRLVIALGYTTIVPGVAATVLWFLLVGRIGMVPAATFHFLNPVFGVAIAAALLGEPLTHWDAIGVTIVALGILLVQTQRFALPKITLLR